MTVLGGVASVPGIVSSSLFVVGLLVAVAVPTATLTRPAALPTLVAAVAAVLGSSIACRGSPQLLYRWEVDIWSGEVVRAGDHAPVRPRPSLSLLRHRPRLSRCVGCLATVETRPNCSGSSCGSECRQSRWSTAGVGRAERFEGVDAVASAVGLGCLVTGKGWQIPRTAWPSDHRTVCLGHVHPTRWLSPCGLRRRECPQTQRSRRRPYAAPRRMGSACLPAQA